MTNDQIPMTKDNLPPLVIGAWSLVILATARFATNDRPPPNPRAPRAVRPPPPGSHSARDGCATDAARSPADRHLGLQAPRPNQPGRPRVARLPGGQSHAV